jgi:hypothetical protein
VTVKKIYPPPKNACSKCRAEVPVPPPAYEERAGARYYLCDACKPAELVEAPVVTD